MARTRKLAIVKSATVARVEAPVSERIDNMVQALAWKREDAEKRATSAIAEFANKATTPSALLYQMTWGENVTSYAIAATMWERVTHAKAQVTALEAGEFAEGDVMKSSAKADAWLTWYALDCVLAELTDSLMRDEWRGGSTSDWRNAVDAATRAAASQFVRECRVMCNQLKALLERFEAEQVASDFRDALADEATG